MVGQPAGVLARERLGGVPPGQRHQLALLAALRNLEVDRAAAACREECLEVGPVGELDRQQDLRRDRGRARVELLEEAAQDFVVRRVRRRVEQEHVAPDELAVADREELHARLVVLAGEPDEVELGPGERGHLLRLHRPLDRPDLVAQDDSPLELHLLGRGLHLLLQGPDHDLLAAFEERLDLGDVGPIRGLVDRLDARRLAALDVVQQARPLEGPLAVPDVDRAGPEREEAPDEVHRLVDAAGRRVRPEIAAAVVDELPGALDAREVVGHGDLDVGVALVVLEADVEARLVALDEGGLEEQRLAHRVDDRVVDLGDPVDDLADPVALHRPGLLLPVAAHAAAQALGLADVDDLPALVLHEVHAGPVGQVLEGRFELGGHERNCRVGARRGPSDDIRGRADLHTPNAIPAGA